MVLPAPAPRMAAGALLLLLLFSALTPGAAAQAPTLPAQAPIAFAVQCQSQYLQAVRVGAPGETTCLVQDLTRDAPFVPGSSTTVPVTSHSVELRIANQTPDQTSGWKIEVAPPFVPTVSGQSVPIVVRAIATPIVASSDVSFDVLANYTGPGGQTASQVLHFRAQVQRFDAGDIEILSGKSVQKAGQNKVVTIPVQILNDGVYPELFHVSAVSNDPLLALSVPGGIYVQPKSRATFNITALTPHEKLYELGQSDQISIKVSSSGGAIYSRTAIVDIEGLYVANYWIPVSIMVLISAVVVTRRAREAAQIRELERQRPRRPEPSPRQAVLLAELKRQDRARYAERVAADQATYKEKRASWLAAYRERRAKDKAEARDAKREFKAARKAQQQERARLARERKEARLAEKDAQAEARQKEKLLAKKRKELGAAREKADKKQAKLDAKQAKIDAKAAAKAAKEQAKAEKAAAKAAKKQKKS